MAKGKDEDLPGTLQRSPTKARRTYRKAHDSAVETYGEGERAHRTAFSAVKHSFEKQGDHWEPKKRKGPSDPQAAKSGKAARNARGRPRPTPASTPSVTPGRSCTSGPGSSGSRAAPA